MPDVLVLNADARPLSYLPLSLVEWKEAITYMCLDKCAVLEWYDDWIVSSPSWETRVPAVIMLKDMYKRKSHPRFSKNNVYLRDLYDCQYCDKNFAKRDLTIDHVVPISKGGKTNWTNIVTACKACNVRKGARMDITPLRKPYQPDYYELVNKRKQMKFDLRQKSWEQYI